ncbi:MAG: aldehyde dehydrogenase family protein [Syntrophobacteraceae bacterium]
MNEFSERLKAIEVLAERLEARKEDLQEAAAVDAGFPVTITAIEVDLGVQHLRTMHEEIPWVEGRKPYGTVAAIFPYDAGAVMLARLGGSALMTGNRLRFSFTSQTPRTARLIAEVCEPISTVHPVLGMDNRTFGLRCVEDPDVRVLFMSGASAVGEAYRTRHEAFDKLFFAGPGGMPAAVVFEDADPDAAARFIGRRAFINGGQYCTTLKKALVHRKHFDSVRDAVLSHVQSFVVGDPLDPKTDIGPIRVQRTRAIVQNAVNRCSAARTLMGGLDGEWIHPIVMEADAGWEIPDLELFGPFLILKPFDDPEEAVRELTRTRYGFLLSFFGNPSEEVRNQFRAHFGMVYDNPDFFFSPLRIQFGGRKESGWIIERDGEGWKTRDGAFLYSQELGRPA